MEKEKERRMNYYYECRNKENTHNNNNNNNNGAYCYYHPREIVVGVCHLCLNERLLILAAKQGLTNNNHKIKSSTINNYMTNSTAVHNKSKPSISSLPKIFSLGSFLRHRRFHRRNSDRNFHFLHFADDLDSASTSLEDDSFISIKFGDNGVAVASWDKSTNSNNNTVSKVSLDNCSSQTSVKPGTTTNTKASCNANINIFDKKINHENINDNKCVVVEHAKPRGPLRWRNRIGHLLQVIRWKRSSKAAGNHDNISATSNNININNCNKNKNNYNVNKVEGVNEVRNNNKGWIKTLNIRTKV